MDLARGPKMSRCLLYLLMTAVLLGGHVKSVLYFQLLEANYSYPGKCYVPQHDLAIGLGEDWKSLNCEAYNCLGMEHGKFLLQVARCDYKPKTLRCKKRVFEMAPLFEYPDCCPEVICLFEWL